MFGYVTIDKPRLTCGDFEIYQGVYCSLCRELGRRYGPLARLTLNYDMTFYALLALAQQEQCPGFKRGRCSFNPAKRCLKLNGRNPALALAADVSMLIACAKWQDTMIDSRMWGKILWALPGLFFIWAGRRAAKAAPQAGKIIRTAMAAQRLVEENPSGLDQCTHPSAHALGMLCALLKEEDEHASDPFYRLGYLLGRWVYFMDAADDYDEDRKRGRFNAFASCGENPEEVLGATGCALLEAWDQCKTNSFQAIFDNLFYSGLTQAEMQVLNKTSLQRKGDGNEESI